MLSYQEYLIERIKPQNAYRDETSLYKKIGYQQRKFKLLLCKVAEVYYFNLIFSDRNNCSNYFTVDILKEDWLSRDENYLWMDISYCDVLQIDILSTNDLIRKISNKFNKFSLIGILNNQKFKKVYKLLKKYKYIKRKNPDIGELSYIVTRKMANTFIKKYNI